MPPKIFKKHPLCYKKFRILTFGPTQKKNYEKSFFCNEKFMLFLTYAHPGEFVGSIYAVDSGGTPLYFPSKPIKHRAQDIIRSYSLYTNLIGIHDFSFFFGRKENSIKAKETTQKSVCLPNKPIRKIVKQISTFTIDFKQNLVREFEATFKTLKQSQNLMEENLLARTRISATALL